MYRLDAIDKHVCPTHHLPYSLRILLENLLRTENGRSVTAGDIKFMAEWKPLAIPSKEIHSGPRAHAGFHRRARGGRPCRHARRHEGNGR
jgi:aconitase A